MSAALEILREKGMSEVEDRLREERRLLDSAHGLDKFDPGDASRKRSKAKQHQYRVGQLIKKGQRE